VKGIHCAVPVAPPEWPGIGSAGFPAFWNEWGSHLETRSDSLLPAGPGAGDVPIGVNSFIMGLSPSALKTGLCRVPRGENSANMGFCAQQGMGLES